MMLTRRQKAQLDRVATLIGEDVVLRTGLVCPKHPAGLTASTGRDNSQGGHNRDRWYSGRQHPG